MTTRNAPPIGTVEGKKPAVEAMFNTIAPRYDLLNRVLSGGIDQRWRNRVVADVLRSSPSRILDVATGTADLAIMAARKGAVQVVGVDIAEDMLAVGREKIRRAALQEVVTLQRGDAEKLPFSDNQFDAVMVSFGVRNFEDLDVGLAQVFRVLRPGGHVHVLEFSRPSAFPIKQLYAFYNRFILPAIGRLVSGDAGAYTYLPESIAAFPEGDQFLEHLASAGFEERRGTRLTFGVASHYVGVKRRGQAIKKRRDT